MERAVQAWLVTTSSLLWERLRNSSCVSFCSRLLSMLGKWV